MSGIRGNENHYRTETVNGSDSVLITESAMKANKGTD